MKQKLISVVIPAYNEEEGIKNCYTRVVGALKPVHDSYEILFIDDGSTDRTFTILSEIAREDATVKVIKLSRNFGHQIALSAGLDRAKGDAVAVLDADLQDPPEIIPRFLEQWSEGAAVVYGIRTKRKENVLKRFAYWLFYRMLHSSANLSIPLDAGDFCLMDRRVVDLIRALPERNRFVRGLRSWAGFRQVGILYERGSREAGKSKYSLRKLFRLALDGMFAFSNIPLRFATLIGILVATLAFIGILFVLYLRLAHGILGIPGFSSTVIAILFLGGVQLISIGILGEYIGRIYEEVKGRPLYVVEETVNI